MKFSEAGLQDPCLLLHVSLSPCSGTFTAVSPASRLRLLFVKRKQRMSSKEVPPRSDYESTTPRPSNSHSISLSASSPVTPRGRCL